MKITDWGDLWYEIHRHTKCHGPSKFKDIDWSANFVLLNARGVSSPQKDSNGKLWSTSKICRHVHNPCSYSQVLAKWENDTPSIRMPHDAQLVDWLDSFTSSCSAMGDWLIDNGSLFTWLLYSFGVNMRISISHGVGCLWLLLLKSNTGNDKWYEIHRHTRLIGWSLLSLNHSIGSSVSSRYSDWLGRV